MGINTRNSFGECIKKRVRQSERPLTVALLFQRAMSLGMSYTEAFNEDIGFIHDLITEKNNDSHEYAEIGTKNDFINL